MNPVKISQSLKQMLVDYLATIFDVNKDGKEPELAKKIRESLEAPRSLSTGPFLELIYPYSTQSSIRELSEKGILSKQLLDLPCFSLDKPEPIPLDTPLYTHQCRAIQKLSNDEKSIVVSAGTGSGKTEAFTIPIVNDLLKDDTPGVRALLVYPLNALVNDQMERLRVMLKGTQITFGRFTSELPNEENRDSNSLPNEIVSRDEIRVKGRIPQILITNYAMLEYLLLRPEDSILFNSGLWKYIVLDEAHTYSGAQGIEVAMLIRRLKQRLGKKPGEMICIATSATLVNDDPNAAVDFAKNLFGEDFESDDIIFGAQEKHFKNNSKGNLIEHPSVTYLKPEFYEILNEVRKETSNSSKDSDQNDIDLEILALNMEEIGLIDTEVLSYVDQYKNDVPGFLYKALSNNSELNKLQNWMLKLDRPALFEDAAKFVFDDLDEDDQEKALYHLIELGASARVSDSQLPLLPAKYHLFTRSPQGLWACLNPNCPGKDPNIKSNWSRIYSNPINNCESCGAKVFPIHLCRQCGQPFIATHYSRTKKEFLPATEQLADGYEKRYFTWSPIEENQSLADEFEDEEYGIDSTVQNNSDFVQKEIRLCLVCGKLESDCQCGSNKKIRTLYDFQKKENKTRSGKKLERLIPLKSLTECPRCRSKAIGETEIATPVTIRGTGPLANLTHELYRQLPPSNDPQKKKLPGEGRKLLSFYDSRQGAARFAAFLQDVSNKQIYRHIIPVAIKESLTPDEWGDAVVPGLITLSKKCADIAWKNGVINNDPDTDQWRGSKKITSDNKKNNAILMATKILTEFTTGRKSRQSLESMGIVGISYFAKDDRPDFENLASRISLSEEQTEVLVSYLLDDLRYQKVITFPTGVDPQDPEFGNNKGNPSVIRQGKPNYGEIRWIGATERQRRRQYIKTILEENKLDSSNDNVILTLNEIWDWMVNIDGLLKGSSGDGYRINHNHLYFDIKHKWFKCEKCQRLSCRGDSLPCPHPYCGGKYLPIDIKSTQQGNYFFNLFQQELIPIRVEEHTAQLDSEKGSEYQNYFKAGFINVLSCSTTFEMGIDLGDLQTVVMSNVPPTVANYRQRAGRAGRRTSGTAYILTWTTDRPHDQTYYNSPQEIISGEVMVPNIMLENELILRRHVNAILLSLFLRYRKEQGVDPKDLVFSGNFFDNILTDKPHYYYIDEWVKKEKGNLEENLLEYANALPSNIRHIVKNGLENFRTDLRTLNDEHYQPISHYYEEQISNSAIKLQDTTLSYNEGQKIENQLKYFRGLLNRLRGAKGKTSGYLIDYLSNKGVLPSYSFPLNTVELQLPRTAQNSEHLRLERDLRQAIMEYSPGSEIVADKRIWKSKQPIFWRDIPPVFEYSICENCHHLKIGKEAGVKLSVDERICPVCHQPYSNKSRIRSFVEPDGFLADENSGKPAKQYVNIEPNQMRSALIPESNIEEEKLNEFIFLSYNQKGKLLYVNEGKFGRGFSFPLKAFAFMSDNKKTNNKLSLGYIQNTNTLSIRFSSKEEFCVPSPQDQSFWLSLLYAIIHGASHCLQIDRQDIDGVLFPRSTEGSWEQTIVLYDNVPGGAGHVKNIKDNFMIVLDEARRILNCNDCAPDTSCYHCLRDYSNQYFHQFLRRDHALQFLDLLIASQEPLSIDVPGAVKVNTSSPENWLDQKIRYTKQSLRIAISKLDTRHPAGENMTWLDSFSELINKGCKIELALQQLPNQDPEGFSLATHLQVLIDKGLILWQVKSIPTWQIIIDEMQMDERIIGNEDMNEKIQLSDSIMAKRLLTSTHKNAVMNAVQEWQEINKIKVNRKDLNPPQHVQVINLKGSSRKLSEQDLFSDFFIKPCTRLLVHDPYLHDTERIVNRLGAYIALAEKQGQLEKVNVYTKKMIDNGEQQTAISKMKRKWGDLVRFYFNADHDRFIEVERTNGEKARIIIGRGLDFINADGSTKSTYIVIQDPMSK